jgi:membrane protein YqaA with SNARE-associated domain
MKETENSRPPAGNWAKFTGWCRKNWLSILIIALIVVVTLVLFRYRGAISQWADTLGRQAYIYADLASFIICLVSSLTIILPVPSFAILIPLASIFPPVPLAVAGATGGIIGELSGYVAGRSGRNMFAGNKTYQRTEGWMKKYGAWMIGVLAFVPFAPFDVAGIICGALRFPVWKFLVAGWIGKTLKFILILVFSDWFIRIFPGLFGG